MKKGLAVLSLILALAPPAHAQDIVIGQSVALSGTNADIGRDMRDGALAVFARVNASKSLGSRRLKLVTLDNANNRQRALENTQQLLGAQGALALFGYNSATNSIDSLPLAARYNVLFFAPFSGSLALRSHPNVFTIRASYKEEALKIIDAKRSVGADRAVVLYYDDEVGRSNFDAVVAAHAEVGLARPPGVAIKRGAALDTAALDAVLKSPAHYVLATTQFGAVRDLLKAAGDKGVPLSVAALSFVNPDELAESAGGLARGTMVSQVIPSPRPSNQVSVPLIRECAEALNALNGAKLNYTSLESCIAATALVTAIRKAGPNPTRESILHAMDAVDRLDLGGYSLQFSPTRHQGSNWVELTMLSRGNRFVQ
ncbi:ABC transporter substrate-binding protein [Ideonella sp.]|uniref:ABC transporter substrate-binding protein n=1 Tax=Ideonella sp. TaxID=1929293 RepID=UPI002B4A8163|nr:ABC transporter substrate-binding protein [Ideonella sp.]HJV70140.1 ABC transporter substrate-binding protein [Ideonella sp.]